MAQTMAHSDIYTLPRQFQTVKKVYDFQAFFRLSRHSVNHSISQSMCQSVEPLCHISCKVCFVLRTKFFQQPSSSDKKIFCFSSITQFLQTLSFSSAIFFSRFKIFKHVIFFYQLSFSGYFKPCIHAKTLLKDLGQDLFLDLQQVKHFLTIELKKIQ